MAGCILNCPVCSIALGQERLNRRELVPCGVCGARLQVRVFPAAFQAPAAGSAGERILVEGESACFFHAGRKAVIPCDACGRFLCALCDLEMNGRHLCPACLEAGRPGVAKAVTEKRRVVYDGLALGLALVPLIVWPLTAITCLATLVLVVWAWRKPGGLVPRSKWRFIVAAIVALLQLAAWIAGIGYLISQGSS